MGVGDRQVIFGILPDLILSYDGFMASKLFSLEQRVAYTLLEGLESHEMSWDRAVEISKQVLQIIPDDTGVVSVATVIKQLEQIPELVGLGFGLGELNI